MKISDEKTNENFQMFKYKECISESLRQKVQ